MLPGADELTVTDVVGLFKYVRFHFDSDNLGLQLAEIYCVDVLMFSGFEPLTLTQGSASDHEDGSESHRCTNLQLKCKLPRIRRLPKVGAS